MMHNNQNNDDDDDNLKSTDCGGFWAFAPKSSASTQRYPWVFIAHVLNRTKLHITWREA